MKVCIATSRDIGKLCREWAERHKLAGVELVDNPEDSHVFISVLYDKLLKKDFIEPRRCYNFHPGILPWYRGAGAYSWAIINGEIETGVTLHEIDESIDTGPVIEIRRFPIRKIDTAESLFRKAETLIYEMFTNWFSLLIDGGLPVTYQESGRTYLRKHLEEARDLTRFVRAFTFTGKPSAYYINRNGEKTELIL